MKTKKTEVRTSGAERSPSERRIHRRRPSLQTGKRLMRADYRFWTEKSAAGYDLKSRGNTKKYISFMPNS